MNNSRNPRARLGQRALWGALVFSLALLFPPAAFQGSTTAAAEEPAAARPQIATYAGAPLGGSDPRLIAQQPFGLAVLGRYSFIADPVNHVVRLLIDKTEYPFAGNGGAGIEGDGAEPGKAQLGGPYAVAAGQVTRVGYQITAFDVYIADTFGHQVRKVSVTTPAINAENPVQTSVITTVAGTGAFGFAGDGGRATSARLNSPYGVAWDRSRNVVYVSDTLNHRVRAVAPDGTMTTVAGTGTPGYSAKETVAAKAQLNQPRGLATDPNGRLYIADAYNNVVRRYDPADGSIVTVAGDGTAGFSDGVQATVARLKQPASLAIDARGNLYIADTGNNVIREVGSDNVMVTVAGGGTSSADAIDATEASLVAPFGVAARDDGDVLIADTGHNQVRVLDRGPGDDGSRRIRWLAGNGTPSFALDNPARDEFRPPEVHLAGPSAVLSRQSPTNPNLTERFILDTFNHSVRWMKTQSPISTLVGVGQPGPPDRVLAKTAVAKIPAFLSHPMGMALDKTGDNLYIADTFNNVVRKVDLTLFTITTVAGDGRAGFIDDVKATEGRLSYPTGVAIDSGGNLFIADAYNGRIRIVDSQTQKISTYAGTGKLGFLGDGLDADQADFYFPYGVTVDGASPPNLYVTDSFNHRVRRITNKHLVDTVAGDGLADFSDGDATGSHLNRPWSSAVDDSNLYIADFLNDRVRRVDSNQKMTTMTGISSAGLKGDSGLAEQAEISGPRGLSVFGRGGALLVADSFNDRVRWLGVTQARVPKTEIHFSPTNLAGQSPVETVTVSSAGAGLLVIGSVGMASDTGGDFYFDRAADRCSQQRLEPGTSCSFSVAFQPRSPGVRTGNLVISNDAIGGTRVISLTGKATAPVARLDRSTMHFSQAAGSASQAQAVVLSNRGDGPLKITSIAVDGSDFSQSNNCPGSLLPEATCTITISLKEIASGSRTGTLRITDDSAGNPLPSGSRTRVLSDVSGTVQTVQLTGGLSSPSVTLTPSTLTFSQNLGGSSLAQGINLTNSGDAPLNISQIRAAGDFVQTNNCPAALAPNASCVVSVSFTPTTTGERDGYLVLADDATDSPQKLALAGVGTLPSANLGPAQLSFVQNVGVTSKPQTVVLGNSGDGPLTINNITVTGDYAQSNNCPRSIAPRQTCSINITFIPAGTGTRNGSLTVSDDSQSIGGNQQTVQLNGVGHQPAVSLNQTVLSPSANSGQTAAPDTIQVTNTGDGVLTIRSVELSGGAAADYQPLQTDCVTSLAPGATCSVTLRFHPSATGVRLASLVIRDDAPGGAQTITLRGVGTSPNAVLSTGSLNFGASPVGAPSLPQSLILVNSGNGPLTISGISSTNEAEFSVSYNCPTDPSQLGSAGSCMIRITFTPRGLGLRTGTIRIQDDSRSGPVQTILLSGTGT
jgi:sugar lactone lactonase YvrE